MHPIGIGIFDPTHRGFSFKSMFLSFLLFAPKRARQHTMGDNPITKLVGFGNFKRHNPHTDRFEMDNWHHIEFWCQDATNVSKRFAIGMGMQQIARSDQSTSNYHYASYVMKTNELVFTFTAPYSKKTDKVCSPKQF